MHASSMTLNMCVLVTLFPCSICLHSYKCIEMNQALIVLCGELKALDAHLIW